MIFLISDLLYICIQLYLFYSYHVLNVVNFWGELIFSTWNLRKQLINSRPILYYNRQFQFSNASFHMPICIWSCLSSIHNQHDPTDSQWFWVCFSVYQGVLTDRQWYWVCFSVYQGVLTDRQWYWVCFSVYQGVLTDRQWCWVCFSVYQGVS